MYIAAKTDFKYDGNQTRQLNVVLRKVLGTKVTSRTVCSYNVGLPQLSHSCSYYAKKQVSKTFIKCR